MEAVTVMAQRLLNQRGRRWAMDNAKLQTIGFSSLVIITFLAAGCLFDPSEDEYSHDPYEREYPAEVERGSQGNNGTQGTTNPPDEEPPVDELAGRWNLRIDFDEATYSGAGLLACTNEDDATCEGGDGVVDVSEIVAYLCDEHELCFDPIMVAEFARTQDSEDPRAYTLNPDAEDGGADGTYLPLLNLGFFAMNTEIVGTSGELGGVFIGYADQLLINTSRPSIDEDFEEEHDGTILIELAAGLQVNGWAAIGGAVLISLPFDAVHCDTHPTDCSL